MKLARCLGIALIVCLNMMSGLEAMQWIWGKTNEEKLFEAIEKGDNNDAIKLIQDSSTDLLKTKSVTWKYQKDTGEKVSVILNVTPLLFAVLHKRAEIVGAFLDAGKAKRKIGVAQKIEMDGIEYEPLGLAKITNADNVVQVFVDKNLGASGANLAKAKEWLDAKKQKHEEPEKGPESHETEEHKGPEKSELESNLTVLQESLKQLKDKLDQLSQNLQQLKTNMGA